MRDVVKYRSQLAANATSIQHRLQTGALVYATLAILARAQGIAKLVVTITISRKMVAVHVSCARPDLIQTDSADKQNACATHNFIRLALNRWYAIDARSVQCAGRTQPARFLTAPEVSTTGQPYSSGTARYQTALPLSHSRLHPSQGCVMMTNLMRRQAVVHASHGAQPTPVALDVSEATEYINLASVLLSFFNLHVVVQDTSQETGREGMQPERTTF